MKSTCPLLLALLLLLPGISARAEFAFTVKTLPAQMRYDVTELIVQPGVEVKITFENPDDMPHNLIFFQPGTDVVAVCNHQLEKPDEALKRNWLPEDPRMWMHSKTLNPREKEVLVFKTPEQPGIYPYVCSMPGHAAIMQGKMKVFAPGPGLSALKFAVYLGSWKTLPDFSALQPHREGDIADNLIQLKFDDYKNEYGVVFTGKINAPANGDYTFAITSDDGSRVSVDGHKVVEYDGVHPSTGIKTGKVKLTAGEHDLRVDYFQGGGQAELFVGWSGANFDMTPLSKWAPADISGAGKAKPDDQRGIPLIVDQEPVIYRNFIEGAGNRGIGVGYPGGMNIAWSAQTMNLALAWRGAFIDAAKHWRDRGGGAQQPLGYDVLSTGGASAPPFAVLSAPTAEWPKVAKEDRPPEYQWKGYTLDARRMPTFQYVWNGVKVAERYEAVGDAVHGEGKLVRTLQLDGPIPAGAMFRVLAGNVRPRAEGGFLVDSGNPFTVTAEGAQVTGNNLIAPATPKITVTYAWPATHANHAGHAILP